MASGKHTLAVRCCAWRARGCPRPTNRGRRGARPIWAGGERHSHQILREKLRSHDNLSLQPGKGFPLRTDCIGHPCRSSLRLRYGPLLQRLSSLARAGGGGRRSGASRIVLASLAELSKGLPGKTAATAPGKRAGKADFFG